MAPDNGPTKNQQKAIFHHKGPALVVAGPGSGKTFVLVKRVKNLIEEHKVNPKKILMTTFTDKAANELKIRISENVGKEKSKDIKVSTIHSFCKSMLEKYFLNHEYGTNIDVLDEESRKIFLQVYGQKIGIIEFKGYTRDVKYTKEKDFLSEVASFYDVMTENKIPPKDLIENLEKSGNLNEEDKKIIEGYEKYRKIMRNEKKMDFSMLQTKFYNLLKENPGILAEIQDEIEFLMVDEYQDTNPIQHKILKLISGERDNFFVVGDEYQSIYGFRGADRSNFMKFLQKKGTGKYSLKTNFRSTEYIVKSSNEIFEKNFKKDISRILSSYRGYGEKVRVVRGKSPSDTAKRTAKMIKDMKDKGIMRKYSDVALLFRTMMPARSYKNHLKKENIPYTSTRGEKFLNKVEIETMIYLLNYVTLSKQFEEKIPGRWKKWWRKDLFTNEFLGLSEKTKEIIKTKKFSMVDLKNEKDFSSLGIADEGDKDRIREINKVRSNFEKKKADSRGHTPTILELFYEILDNSGYFERLVEKVAKKDNESSYEKEKLHSLGKLSQIIYNYMRIRIKTTKKKEEDFDGFMRYLQYRGDRIYEEGLEKEDAVKIMTVHKAKGLEFPVVFVCSLEEGNFPYKSKEDFITIPDKFLDKETRENKERENEEEELRIFYVAITRARDDLVLTASEKRSNGDSNTPFLDMIPEELVSEDTFKLGTEEKESEKYPPTISYSAINTFIDCPLRYAMIYDYGFVTPQSYAQNLGTFVHNTLQKIHESLKRKENLSNEKIEEFVNESWMDLPTNADHNRKMKRDHLEAFISYYNSAKEYYEEIIAIEEPFSYVDKNMVVKGRVDLIAKNKDGKICLIDFKSRTEEGLEKTHVKDQLQIYNLFMNGKYDIQKLIAYTFEDGQRKEFPMEELKKTQDFLNKMSKRIEKEDFFRKDRCNGECAFGFYCKRGRKK